MNGDPFLFDADTFASRAFTAPPAERLSETSNVTLSCRESRQTRTANAPHRLAQASLLVLVAGLGACSSIENLAAGDKVDYRTSGNKTAGLEVPPDLTQLARDSRYQQPGGPVSATTYQAAGVAAAPTTSGMVAVNNVANMRIERQGAQRWLVTPMTPEQLWPQLQNFWKERGFTLTVDTAAVGVMETEWAENRAKLPKDLIRSTLGPLVDSLYSTGERDKFRTRVERTATGTEVYITHKGLSEEYANDRKDATVWQARPSDPQLEAEMLQRLIVKLGAKEEEAKTLVATGNATGTPTAPQGPARARVLSGQAAATLQVDEGFDRAWRRVGLALDRSGFTVEDRDRNQGLYFVRYVDPANAGKEEPGFFSKLFSFGKSQNLSGPTRYRVAVKADGERSTVSVLGDGGSPENGEAGKRIVNLLLEDLR